MKTAPPGEPKTSVAGAQDAGRRGHARALTHPAGCAGADVERQRHHVVRVLPGHQQRVAHDQVMPGPGDAGLREGDLLENIHRETLVLSSTADDTVATFSGTVPLDRSGSFGYNVRVVPKHPLLASPAELGLIAVMQ